MKIKPVTKRGHVGSTSFTCTVNDTDAVFLASLLSYARNAGLDSFDPSEQKRAVKILEQLVAACEAINCEADGHLQERGPAYYKTLELFGIPRELAP